jgi:hypothetical protein
MLCHPHVTAFQVFFGFIIRSKAVVIGVALNAFPRPFALLESLILKTPSPVSTFSRLVREERLVKSGGTLSAHVWFAISNEGALSLPLKLSASPVSLA